MNALILICSHLHRDSYGGRSTLKTYVNVNMVVISIRRLYIFVKCVYFMSLIGASSVRAL